MTKTIYLYIKKLKSKSILKTTYAKIILTLVNIVKVCGYLAPLVLFFIKCFKYKSK